MMRKRRNPWLHRYAILVAVATFLLIVVGALVTSNDAGSSISSWPAPFRWPTAMEPVCKYELSHRVVAGAVAILTLLEALWLWAKEERRWVRRLGGAGVLAILAQAIVGGIRVQFPLSPLVSSVAHACLGQLFFSVMVSLAVFTSPRWDWNEAKLDDRASPPLRQLALSTTGAIFVQLLLGALFRHHAFGIIPHVVVAGLVTVGVLWLVLRVALDYRSVAALRRATFLLTMLASVQVLLGLGAYILIWQNRGVERPLPTMVDVTTVHVAVGALVLVASLLVTYQAYRYTMPAGTLTPAYVGPQVPAGEHGTT